MQVATLRRRIQTPLAAWRLQFELQPSGSVGNGRAGAPPNDSRVCLAESAIPWERSGATSSWHCTVAEWLELVNSWDSPASR